MANLGDNVKTALLKGLEALGKTASTLSDAAQQKLSEMNLETRRREILAEIPKCVMQLWKDGAEMPEPLASLLAELTDVEEKIAAARPQPQAAPAEPAQEEEETAEEETETESFEEPSETVSGTEDISGEAEEEACSCEPEPCDCSEAEDEEQEAAKNE